MTHAIITCVSVSSFSLIQSNAENVECRSEAKVSLMKEAPKQQVS